MRIVHRLALVMLVGCSVARDASTLPSRAGETVTVETRDGTELDATVAMTPTGYVLRLHDGMVLSLDQVAHVRETRHGRGLLHGLGLGVLIGVGGGAVLGFADGDDPPCPSDSGHVCSMYTQSTAADKAMIGGILLGMLGGIVGGVVGLVMGSDDVYSPSPAPMRITPTGPPGSVLGATLTF